LDLSRFADYIQNHPEFGRAVAHHRYLPPGRAAYARIPDLSPEILSAMKHLGLERLYTHQVEAIQGIREGAHVLVATPTASGKSLVFNLAVLEKILKNPDTRALYLFPLKALEHDQMKGLWSWLEAMGNPPVTAEIYDGDTTAYKRKKIRTTPPHILFTNPDMLHRGILPHHEAWEGFLRHLRFVVLDEIHTYRGIFGSHVNQVIRRLKRLCHHYGASPRFILLSATVSNPGAFGRSLVGEPVRVVEGTGSPRAGRHFFFMNPAASPNFSAARLFVRCVEEGFRTIAFTQSRQVTELIHVWVSRLSPRIRSRISSYRAGFMPEERREIEGRLARGDLLGVVSTSALEMGIDIGYLDICLLVGYPGTVINTWQRGGRVGRAGRESMVILVAKPDALDQYFMKHPDDFFGRSFEAAVLDPQNPFVVRAHLPCAAAERPLTRADTDYWEQDLPAHLEALEMSGDLSRTADGDPAWYPTRCRPHLGVDIRAAGDTFTIFERDTGQAIGTVSGIRAFKECHPGAVYLHRARQYLVDRLVLDKKDIVAHRTDLKYFTRVRSEKETEILEVRRSRPEAQFLVREGRLRVTERVKGYEKRSIPGQELMGTFPLELPEQTFETVGFWIEIEDILVRLVEKRGLHFMGGIHAIEHAAIGMFPLFALCDRNDIGGISYTLHPQTGKSAIFIYDAHPGGVGLAQRGFEVVGDLLRKTLEHVRQCACEEGCPSCIHSPKCGNGNKPLDKSAAVLIMEGLLGRISFGEIVASRDQGAESPPPPPQPVPEQRHAPRIVYFDLETRKSAQEVGGWNNAHLMGISVAVLYDSRERRFEAFQEKDVDRLLERLSHADLVVGFNVKRFDYRVLGAYTGQDLLALPTFDILEDVHRRLGFRLGLDHLACETLGRGKTADGLQALAWFRQGEMEMLTRYCREDVVVTRDLFLHGLEKGHLVYREKKTGRRLRLAVDWNLDDLVG